MLRSIGLSQSAAEATILKLSQFIAEVIQRELPLDTEKKNVLKRAESLYFHIFFLLSSGAKQRRSQGSACTCLGKA